MSKNIAIVYWTGTGNTEEMARALESGVAAAGAEARVVPVADFSAEDVSGYDALAFGCPALGDKPVALFGSYGWGTGEWMEAWRADAEGAGVNVVCTVIANEAPDDDAVAELEAAARSLVEA